MEKKRRRSLHNMLTMAFTFAMVLVFAGLAGKVDVKAETTDTYTFTVTSNNKPVNTTEATDKVYLEVWTSYYSSELDKTVYKKVGMSDPGQKVEDQNGVYTVTIDRSEFGDRCIITPAAEIDGYSDYSILTQEDAKFIYTESDGTKYITKKRINDLAWEGESAKYINPADYDEYELPKNFNFAIALTLQTNAEKIENAISKAKDEINRYIALKDYDDQGKKKIGEIRDKYFGYMDDIDQFAEDTAEYVEEQKEIISGYVVEAKKEIDQVSTSQENMNELYAKDISFVDSDGNKTYLGRKGNQYGQYEITLSYFQKEGRFVVENGENVEWNAMTQATNTGNGLFDFQIIDKTYNIGTFLHTNWLNGLKYKDSIYGSFPASVTYKKGEDTITVTFELKVIPRNIFGINTECVLPEVTLDRDENLSYKELTLGTDEGQYYVYVASDDPDYTPSVTIISLSEGIATVDENNTITPLKAGTATFKASADGCDPEVFTIEFVKSDEEVKEDSELDAFDNLIAAIGNVTNVTLDKETAVQTAMDAYDKLSENAKKRLDPDTLNILTKAEATITALKTEAINKAEELKKAQEAANTTTTPTVQLSKIALKAKAAKGKVKLTWKKSSKADGYIIYRATKKNGKYKQIKMIKSWKKNSFTDKKVKSKKTYYYKIRAYKGTVNGPVSAAKKAKVK